MRLLGKSCFYHFHLALVLKEVKFLGALGQITIYPGKTMKVIATVTGPLKKYVGKDLFQVDILL